MAIISVSSPQITKCDEIIHLMRQLNIDGKISKNKTVINGNVENGCRIHVTSEPVKPNIYRLWESMKVKFELSCAHVEIKYNESGCIFDIFRETSCPHANENEQMP